ncbi:Variant surface glycoprotein [Trypanosoma congolense IL3000]|uniref:Variant surface glycoprotein n=1 Tax=Trypanosoma congolense (strain IL3000) TaxID=1068625 RepID=F9W5S6_TRYCI|nr:Variant surface glycoprotein [Trypanosoma congolense IL3000]
MVIGKFALVALVFEVAFGAERPSEDEFNLFCRIFAETNDMMLEPDYVYDEGKDKEIVKEMEVLYNATTGNMDDFGKMLWKTKEFLKEHPPPTNPKNRRETHREIQDLIDKGEKIIQDNRDLASHINQKVEKAKLSVAKGIYGNHVTVVQKEDGNLTKILSNTSGIFNSNTSAKDSCGNESAGAGKTLLNDFFCVCVGEGDHESAGPCHSDLVPPRGDNTHCCKEDCDKECCEDSECCKCAWTQMKYSSENNPVNLTESLEKIEEVCRDLLGEKKETKKIPALLEEYVGMIGHGGAKERQNKTHMFGQSGWGAEDTTIEDKLKECTGSGDVGNGDWKNNNKICVDYTKNYNEGTRTYDIPWHTKFREASEKMDQAKQLKDQILKNRANLLLLKSQAWVAYNREKDDETANLDDMNVSQLFDGSMLRFPSPYLFLTL